MEINGIKIKDMKDAQEVLAALEILKSGIENISDDLSVNHEKYSNINTNFKDISNNQKMTIDALNEIMIKSSNLIDNLSETEALKDSKNDELISVINSDFDKLKSYIKTTLNDVVKNINVDDMKFKITSLIEQQISTLTLQISFLETNNKILEMTNENVKDTIDSFNKISSTLKAKIMSLFFVSGLVVGGVIVVGVLHIQDKILFDSKVVKVYSNSHLKTEEISNDKVYFFEYKSEYKPSLEPLD